MPKKTPLHALTTAQLAERVDQEVRDQLIALLEDDYEIKSTVEDYMRSIAAAAIRDQVGLELDSWGRLRKTGDQSPVRERFTKSIATLVDAEIQKLGETVDKEGILAKTVTLKRVEALYKEAIQDVVEELRHYKVKDDVHEQIRAALEAGENPSLSQLVDRLIGNSKGDKT